MSVSHLNEDYEVPEEFAGFPRELLDMVLAEHDYSRCAPNAETSGVYVHVVVHERHSVDSESTSKIEGIYSSLRNANVAALQLFKLHYRDFMNPMLTTWEFDWKGSGSMWSVNKSHGGVWLENIDLERGGRRSHIRVTKHTIEG